MRGVKQGGRLGSMLGLLLVIGCAGPGAVMNLDLQAVSSGGTAKPGEKRLAVEVTAFEDVRPERARLGVRQHLWGGESMFNVPEGKVGAMVAQVAAETLKRGGWRTEGAPDVTLSGQVQALSVNARSTWGSTQITVKAQVAVAAVNKADGSLVRMTLTGEGVQTVVWFEPEDAQELASEVLSDSFKKLVQQTTVERQVLRLK